MNSASWGGVGTGTDLSEPRGLGGDTGSATCETGLVWAYRLDTFSAATTSATPTDETARPIRPVHRLQPMCPDALLARRLAVLGVWNLCVSRYEYTLESPFGLG